MSQHASKTTRLFVAAAGLTSAAFLLAACSGGTGYGSSGSISKPRGTPAAGEHLATGSTAAGTVLVDAQGRTLYAFGADAPGTSHCAGSCAVYWPPELVSGALTHTSNVTADLGTMKRSDGTTQLTVNGWPVYTYVGDSAAGQATGQGKNLSGGLWWVVSPSGSQIKTGRSAAGY